MPAPARHLWRADFEGQTLCRRGLARWLGVRPRSKKHYKAAIRVNKDSKPETLLLRAFIGTEILGDTEEMTRVASLPSGCKTR